MKKLSNMMFEFRYEGESPKNFKRVVFNGNPTENQRDEMIDLFDNNKHGGLCIVPDVLGLDEPNGHKVAFVSTFWKQDMLPTVGITPSKLMKLIDQMNRDFGRELYNAF